MPGFPAADVADCSPAAYACGYSDAAAREAVASLARELRAREHEFALELYSIDQAILETTRHAAPRGRPLILADTQDNPGAGGHADTMNLIKALPRATRATLAGVTRIRGGGARSRRGEGAQVEPAWQPAILAIRRSPFQGGGARRRPVHRHGPVLSRCPFRARSDGAARAAAFASRVEPRGRLQTRRCFVTCGWSRPTTPCWR
jgi:hypothetical protein